MFYHGFFLSSFFIRHLISELTERNSTTIGHMVESHCDLKTLVQNLGYHSPYKSGAPRPHFWTTSQLNVNFTVLYLQNETRHRQSVKCVDNYKGSHTSSQKSRELSFTNDFKLERHFYAPYVNSAFYVIARLRGWRSANRTQPHFAKRRTIHRANNLL